MSARTRAIAACFAVAASGQATAAVECRIERAPRGALTELRAVLEADAPMEVEARWTLRRSGAAGTSTNRQGTRAALRPGEPRVVARSIVNVAPGDRLEAALAATWPGGEVACALPPGPGERP